MCYSVGEACQNVVDDRGATTVYVSLEVEKVYGPKNHLASLKHFQCLMDQDWQFRRAEHILTLSIVLFKKRNLKSKRKTLQYQNGWKTPRPLKVDRRRERELQCYYKNNAICQSSVTKTTQELVNLWMNFSIPRKLALI